MKSDKFRKWRILVPNPRARRWTGTLGPIRAHEKDKFYLSPKDSPHPTVHFPDEILHELEVQPIELDIQGKDLKESQRNVEKSREQFEVMSYKRLIDIYSSSSKTIDALMKLELPSGVEVEIKV